jgi:ABC-type tungstate transport system permease subunit
MAHRFRSLALLLGGLAGTAHAVAAPVVTEGYGSDRPAVMYNDFVFVGAPAFFNPDGVIPVNPARHPCVNKGSAVRSAQWLTAPAGQPVFFS